MSIPVTLAATLFLQLALERVGSVLYRVAARLAPAVLAGSRNRGTWTRTS